MARRSMMRDRMRDMARRRRDMRSRRGDYGYEMGDRVRTMEHYPEYSYGRDSRYDRTANRREYESTRKYDGHYDYPMMRDYGEKYFPKEELVEWIDDLRDEIEPQFRPMYEKEQIIRRAKEMGVRFDDYTEDEFVATALMIATDYGRTVGMNEIDKIYRMAVDFLEDKDADLQGGEKLFAYYENVVCVD